MAKKGINKVILLGNLGQDPDSKQLEKGTVTSISVATSESWKDKNTGEMKEKAEWHRVVFFNRLAEIAAEYLKKGSKVYIEGSLKTRSWDKDGEKRYATEIVATEMQMLSSKSETQQVSSPNYSNSNYDDNNSTSPGDDDDLPF